jgi:RimJ/RimL family protein N-acetyltransferase
MHLSVKPLEPAEIPLIVSYWHDSDPAFLRGMGVDIPKLPSRENLAVMLRQQLEIPIAQRRSFCLIWLLDGMAVGHCNTNPTTFGEEAFMHLHLWQSPNRQRGLGTELVKLSLPVFFERLQLKTLYCEPYALNPAANRTLERLGFEFVKEYVTTPGPINFEQPVKRWVMEKGKLEKVKMRR